MKNQYAWEESETKEEISELYEKINASLEEYKELSTDDVCKICEDVTGLILKSE